MQKKAETYNNLIDICIEYEEDPELEGDAQKMFNRLLSGYFFRYEVSESKAMEFFLSDFSPPPFLEGAGTLYNIDVDELRLYVQGGMINESLAGSIMLSPPYLKSFYANHPPSFSKLPEDIKFELIENVKEKNEQIIYAFEKMVADIDADRKRKIVTLAALILKNIHHRSGRPMNRITRPVDEILSSVFHDADEIFTATQKQVTDLKDDTKIKELVKTFFVVKKFREITEITDMYKGELDRYKKRVERLNRKS